MNTLSAERRTPPGLTETRALHTQDSPRAEPRAHSIHTKCSALRTLLSHQDAQDEQAWAARRLLAIFPSLPHACLFRPLQVEERKTILEIRKMERRGPQSWACTGQSASAPLGRWADWEARERQAGVRCPASAPMAPAALAGVTQ